MLGRAVAEKPPAALQSKNELAKQLYTSSNTNQNGNIEDGFKKARQSSQSIGGFVGLRNSEAPLKPRSPNIKNNLKRKSEGGVMSSVDSGYGSSSIFNMSSSFSVHDSVKVTQKPSLTFAPPTIHSTTSQCSQAVEGFDENDFDSDCDSGIEYELPGMMAAPPKPTLQRESTTTNTSSKPLNPATSSQQGLVHNPSSSAIPWSSSPPSHLAPPPRRKQPEIVDLDPEPSRPTKRRTLPWAQKKAEDDEVIIRTTGRKDSTSSTISSSPKSRCFRCKELGHTSRDCRNSPKSFEYEPAKTTHDKHMPWNNTSKATAEERKLFKAANKTKREEQIKAASARNSRRSDVVMSPITLSEEQKRVQNLVVNESKSVFFTGSAGTGKSVLMRSIIQELRKKYVREPERVAVTASTGLAACNIGGVTLHSFGGIGLGKEDVPALVKKIKRNQKAKNRWIKTKILIVDEISMVDGDLFDKLEGVARAIRNNGRPFGGIQLVITGDFFQLPPVPDHDNKARGAKFAFDAGTWKTSINHTIGLTEVFRQKDPRFANMLNEMRLGNITEDTIKEFKKLDKESHWEDNIDSTELFPTRNEVDRANLTRMNRLVGKVRTFPAVDSGTITDEGMRDKLLSNMMAPKSIDLKAGAQVMLVKNMDDNLVNGSVGTIVGFMTEDEFDMKQKDGTLDSMNEEYDDDPDTAMLREKVTKRSKEGRPSTAMEYPLVNFIIADNTRRLLLVQPEEWKVELPNGEIQAQRRQLPLILAWALSIHKAQGQTLDRVKIDLRKIFEKGQAYVALSRATSLAGLVVKNFEKSKVMAHPRVAEFYNSLYSVNKALEHPTVRAVPPTNVVEKAKTRTKTQHTSEFDDDDEDVMRQAMRAYG